jgi:lipopolysaccharide biosynthesis regulator YciM
MDTWWLLAIPVIFGLGWIARGFDLKELLSESARLPRSYFNGLNFLLNEQPDRAIEAFIEVVKLDPETIELHFALGNLFRRRGEMERAIRLHRNLLERADLPVEFRDQALFALAQDYLRAGLLDRAESAFKSLADTPHADQAAGFLAEVYQLQSEWQLSIEALRRSGADTPTKSRTIAHLYCELAEAAIERKDLKAARDQLARARTADAALLRIVQIEIGIAAAEQAWARIVELADQTLAEHPEFAPQIVEAYIDAAQHVAFSAPGQRPLDAQLRSWFDASPNDALAAVIIKRLEAGGAMSAALEFARVALQRLPRLSQAHALLRLRAAMQGDGDEDLAHITQMMNGMLRSQKRHECRNCGFRAQRFFWQCPGCKQWDTLPYAASPVGP